jgi:hypothetical protein
LRLGNLFWSSTDRNRGANNKIFLARVDKKQNVDMDSTASSGNKRKHKKYITLPWPLLEVALSMFKFNHFFVKINLGN